MNNKRRGILKEAGRLLERATSIVSTILDEEQDCLDNIPENLQVSEKYERMEDVIDKLEDAIEQMDSAKDSLTEASG